MFSFGFGHNGYSLAHYFLQLCFLGIWFPGFGIVCFDLNGCSVQGVRGLFWVVFSVLRCHPAKRTGRQMTPPCAMRKHDCCVWRWQVCTRLRGQSRILATGVQRGLYSLRFCVVFVELLDYIGLVSPTLHDCPCASGRWRVCEQVHAHRVAR